MIDAIKSEPNLALFIRQKSECCYDGNPVHPYIDDGINEDSIAALAPDEYYNSLNLGDTPPSIDHLITLAYHENSYAHFLIEDKNVRKMRGIDAKHIYNKFKTTLEDFMTKRFGQLYHDLTYPVCSIELYLVTNPQLKKPREKESRTEYNTRLELLLSMPPFKFRGIVVSIKHSNPKALVKRRIIN